jgi:hypothetical protein
MKPEDQVCSRVLATRLQRLGVKQESLFIWTLGIVDGYCLGLREIQEPDIGPNDCAAFTVAELGEMMAGKFIGAYSTMVKKEWWVSGGEWKAGNPGQYKRLETAATEADARAKMLVYLIEQGLVKSPAPTGEGEKKI